MADREKWQERVKGICTACFDDDDDYDEIQCDY